MRREFPAFQAAFQAGVDEGLHLGAQVYASVHGEPVLDLALGDRLPGQPMTKDDLCVWLSTTKPIAAVALAQLWERGQLELDDPIARHLPEFGQKGKEAITLRHALTHTGGFRMLSVGFPDHTWDDIIARICAQKREPRWQPGRRAGYHMESSWFILGEVIRRVDGRRFEHYVRDEIFEPLGMDDCWIGMPADRYAAYGERIVPMLGADPPMRQPLSQANVSQANVKALGWTKKEMVTRCNPAGNGCGPMRQLGRFYEMLLQRGQLSNGTTAGMRILSPQAVEAFTCPHRVGLYDHTFKHVMDWGLGFIINSEHYYREEQQGEPTLPYGYGGHASNRTFGHSGRLTSTAFADPEHGLVVALVLNGVPAEDHHRARMRALTEGLYQDLALTR